MSDVDESKQDIIEALFHDVEHGFGGKIFLYIITLHKRLGIVMTITI